MALPNDGIQVNTGTGPNVATSLIGGKEYQVVQTADGDGHVRGSLPAWGLVFPPQAAAASKVFMDLWNGSAANILRVRKLFMYPTQAVITGTFAPRFDVMRTSAVGTSGTAAVGTSGTPSASKTAATFWPFTPGLSLPSGVSARLAPTGGATDEQWLWPTFIQPEETNPSGSMAQWINLMPELSTEQSVELPPNKGLKIVEDSTASPLGSFAILCVFTVE